MLLVKRLDNRHFPKLHGAVLKSYIGNRGYGACGQAFGSLLEIEVAIQAFNIYTTSNIYIYIIIYIYLYILFITLEGLQYQPHN